MIRRSAINNLVGSPQGSDAGKVAGYQSRDASKLKGSSTLRSQPSGQISLENQNGYNSKAAQDRKMAMRAQMGGVGSKQSMGAEGQGYGVGAGLGHGSEEDKKKYGARDVTSTSLPKSSGFRTNRASSNIKGQGLQSPVAQLQTNTAGTHRLNMSDFGNFHTSPDSHVQSPTGTSVNTAQGNSQSWLGHQHPSTKLYSRPEKMTT